MRRALFSLLVGVALGACGGHEDAPAAPACSGEAEAECVTECGTAGSRARRPGSCELGECAPLGESCNGTDDDCDERADEGLGCVRGASEPCETACGSTGRHTCGDDCRFGECVPPAEVCGNERDDDCDGVVDGAPRVVAERAYETGPRPVSLAADASGLLAVLLEGDTLTGIHRLGDAGAIEDAIVTGRYGLQASSSYPLLRASEGRAAMAWPHEVTLHVLVAGVGPPSTTELLRGEHGLPQTVGLAWVGPALSLAYTRELPGGVRRIFVRRVTARAHVDDEVPVSGGNGVAASPALAVAPPLRTHLVAWEDDRGGEIYTALFGPELQPLRGEAPLTATEGDARARYPDVATDGEGFLVAWSEGNELERHVVVAPVDAEGHAGPARRISVGRGRTGPPRVVWTGSEHWVAWKVEAADGRFPRLMAARVERDGARRGEVLEITHDAGWIGNAPEIAWDDGALHVLWTGADGASHLATLGCE